MALFDDFFPKKKKDSEEELDKKKYTLRVMCKNCRHKQEIYIPKGEVAKDYIKKKVKCEKCDLTQLKVLKSQTPNKEGAFGENSFDDFFDEMTDSFLDEIENEIELRSLMGESCKIKESLLIRINELPNLKNYTKLKKFEEMIELVNKNYLVNVYVDSEEVVYIIANYYFIDKIKK